jgi:hypothetical protein
MKYREICVPDIARISSIDSRSTSIGGWGWLAGHPHGQATSSVVSDMGSFSGTQDEIIDPFLEPRSDTWTLSAVHKVAEMAFRCLAYHRDMRPSMMEVAAELERIRANKWEASEEKYNTA